MRDDAPWKSFDILALYKSDYYYYDYYYGRYGSFQLWINVWVAGKLRDLSLTRAIPERFRYEFLVIKRYTNLRLRYFTLPFAIVLPLQRTVSAWIENPPLPAGLQPLRAMR